MLMCGWHEEGAIKVVAELISDSNKAYKSLTLVTRTSIVSQMTQSHDLHNKKNLPLKHEHYVKKINSNQSTQSPNKERYSC